MDTLPLGFRSWLASPLVLAGYFLKLRTIPNLLSLIKLPLQHGPDRGRAPRVPLTRTRPGGWNTFGVQYLRNLFQRSTLDRHFEDSLYYGSLFRGDDLTFRRAFASG